MGENSVHVRNSVYTEEDESTDNIRLVRSYDLSGNKYEIRLESGHVHLYKNGEYKGTLGFTAMFNAVVEQSCDRHEPANNNE